MACTSCGQRRVLSSQAFQAMKRGDLAAAKQNGQRIVQTVRNDLNRLGQAIRSPMSMRPPTRSR